MAGPVNESLKQIDAHSWLVGEKSILKRTPFAAASGHLWTSADGFFYSIREAPCPLPSAGQLAPDTTFRKVHDCGGVSAVWDLGDVFLKVNKLMDRQGATREHTTLDWLAARKLSFPVPKLLYHAQDDDRNYLIVTRVPGQTVYKVWRSLGEDERHTYAQRVAEIIQELSAWQSNAITWVDGKTLAESWLDNTPFTPQDKQRGYQIHDFAPEVLQKRCEKMGMDCSTLHFCHCDFGPDNVVVDRSKQSIGIIDWEMAGYVPRAWPRTKAEASDALDFNSTLKDYPDESVLEEKEKEWRLMVAQKLGDKGFPKVTEAYQRWRFE